MRTKLIYAARKLDGKCPRCGIDNTGTCEGCQSKIRVYRANYKARSIAKSLCFGCLEPLVEFTKSGSRLIRCEKCRAVRKRTGVTQRDRKLWADEQRRRYKKLKAAKKCVKCTAPSVSSCYCETCRIRKRDAETVRYRARIKARLCGCCSSAMGDDPHSWCSDCRRVSRLILANKRAA